MRIRLLTLLLPFILAAVHGYSFTLTEIIPASTCSQPVIFIPDSLHADSTNVTVQISISSTDFITYTAIFSVTTDLTDTSTFEYLGAVEFVSGDVSSRRYAYRLKSTSYSFSPVSGTVTDIDLVVKYFDDPLINFSGINKTCLSCPVCPNRAAMLYEYAALSLNIFTTPWPYTNYYDRSFVQLGGYERAAVTQALNWILDRTTSVDDYFDMLNFLQAGSSVMPSSFCTSSAGAFDCTNQKAIWLCAHAITIALSGISLSDTATYDSFQVATFETSSINCIGGGNYAVYVNSNDIGNGYEVYFIPGLAGYPTVLGAVIFNGGNTYSTLAYSYNFTPVYGIYFDVTADTFAYAAGFRPVPPDIDIANGALPFSNITVTHATPLMFCSGGNVVLSASASVAGSLEWSTSATTDSITVSTSGSYSVTLTDAESCTAVAPFTVTVWSIPTAYAGTDDSICIYNAATIGTSPAATGGTPPYSYSWTPTTGLNSGTVSQPVVAPVATTTYVLTVTDSNACKATDTMIVTVNCIPADVVDRVAAAPYIFEGQVVSSVPYWSSNHKVIYTSNIVEVIQTLKGGIECGTVEILVEGGTMDSVTEMVSNTLQLREGNAGIFMCGLTDRIPPLSRPLTLTNTQELGAIFEEQSLINYWWDGEQIQASDMLRRYGTLSDVYAILEAATAATWVDCGGESSINKKGRNNKQVSVPKNTAVKSKVSISHKGSDTSGKNKSYSRGTDIYYTLENETVTPGTHQYLDFDVYIMSSEDSYFHGGEVELQYDPATFGDSIGKNFRIEVTPGPILPDSSSFTFITDVSSDVVDISSEVVGIYGESYCAAYNEELLYHIRIQIADCVTSDVAFTNSSTMLSGSYYYTVDSIPNVFDDAIVGSSIECEPSCDVHISSFFPSNINGGIGDTLTISGFNFEYPRGVGNLYFKNANDGGNSEISLNSYDYIYWSDSLIKVLMPSTNDTVVNGSGLTSKPFQPIGSGYFRIVTKSNSQATSNVPLNVLYSVTNSTIHASLGGKHPVQLTAPNTNAGYKFYVDTIIWKDTNKLACVRKALRDWTCLTGVNWVLDTFTTKTPDTIYIDNINVIKFGNTATDPLGKVLATTKQWTYHCGEEAFCDEIDLIISSDTSTKWSYDTTGANLPSGKEDFLGVLLHELGHGQSLNHVNDPLAVMYYRYPAAGSIASKRKINLQADASCQRGGNEVMLSSASVIYSCSGSFAPVAILPNYICAPFHNGIETVPVNSELLVYPNPAGDNITLDFWNRSQSKTNFDLYNVYGQKLFSVKPYQIQNGRNSMILNLERYPAGIYVLCGWLNGQYFENKIVHLDNL